MCSLKNIIKNLLRNKVRNIFNMIIMIIMISAIAISGIINSSTSIVIANYKKKFESEVQININQEKLAENTYNGISSKDKELSASDYLRFADSKYVNKSFFTGSMLIYIEKLTNENGKNSELYNLNTENQFKIDKEIDTDKQIEDTQQDNISQNKLYDETRNINGRIIGYTNKDKGFKLPNIKIQEGNIFKNNNECIVNEEFLKLNNFDIGDEITISSGYKDKKDKKLVLKIVGTYKRINNKANLNTIINEDIEINDEILTTYDTLVKYEESLNLDIPLMYTNAKFLLKSYKDRQNFEEELRRKGLSNIYKLTIDEDAYRKVVEPVEHLSNISFISMFTILILGSFILFIISMLSIKNIKYDIGVLRIFGISKLKIIRSFLYESIIMTIVCLLLGMGIGTSLSQPVSNYVLECQKDMDKSEGLELYQGVIDSSINDDIKQEIKSINIKQSKDFILKITTVGILLSLLTSIVAIYNVMIYKTIEIISDRN